MKELKFHYKFIDHTTKTRKIIAIIILLEKKYEWVQTDDLEEHLNIMTKHLRWEAHLGTKVKQLIADVYFNGDSSFSGYQMVKKKEHKGGEMVNMNHMTSDNRIVLRKVHWTEDRMMKYTKGKIEGESWTKLFDYEMNNYYHVFKLDPNVDATNVNQPADIKWEKICDFVIPNQNLISIQSSAPNQNNTFIQNSASRQNIVSNPNIMKNEIIGGMMSDPYHAKYLKYKNKYSKKKHHTGKI